MRKNKLMKSKALSFFAFGLGLIASSSFITATAHAVPVMNENAALSGLITIFPDHADPNLFYIAPNVMSVCMADAKTPRFSYQDLLVKGSMHAIVQMTLCAQYDQGSLDAAEAQMLKARPTAKFTALPFVASRVIFDPVLAPYMVTQFCGHAAGMVGDEQVCAFQLNHIGRAVFNKQMRRQVAMTMQYQYQVAGFVRKPDNSFAAQLTEYAVAVRIGGEELGRGR